jgi:hypothetical protein
MVSSTSRYAQSLRHPQPSVARLAPTIDTLIKAIDRKRKASETDELDENEPRKLVKVSGGR